MHGRRLSLNCRCSNRLEDTRTSWASWEHAPWTVGSSSGFIYLFIYFYSLSFRIPNQSALLSTLVAVVVLTFLVHFVCLFFSLSQPCLTVLLHHVVIWKRFYIDWKNQYTFSSLQIHIRTLKLPQAWRHTHNASPCFINHAQKLEWKWGLCCWCINHNYEQRRCVHYIPVSRSTVSSSACFDAVLEPLCTWLIKWPSNTHQGLLIVHRALTDC